MSAAANRLPPWLVACEARHPDGWVCTRNKGHGAAHQAFVDASIVASWSSTTDSGPDPGSAAAAASSDGDHPITSSQI